MVFDETGSRPRMTRVHRPTNDFSLDDVRVEGCTFELERRPGLTLRLRGAAEATAGDTLGVLFTRMHEECVRVGARELRIDLRHLEVMSSSCFKDIVSWVLRIEALPVAQRYSLVLVHSQVHAWQRRSLRALAAMGPDVIVLEGGVG